MSRFTKSSLFHRLSRRSLVVAFLALEAGPGAAQGVEPDAVSFLEPFAIRGIAYQSYQQGGFADATQTPVLDLLTSTRANWISFNTPFIFDPGTQQIGARAGVTDFAGLGTAIDRAKARSLKTAIYVFVQTDTYGSFYEPSSRPTDVADFFRQLKILELQYADLAQSKGVDLLILGNEMNALSGPDYKSYWLDIISSVRKRYTGKITYGAIPNLFQAPSRADVDALVSFWEELDYLSFSFYPRLSTKSVPTRSEIEAGWRTNVYTGNKIMDNLKAYATVTGKPVLLTEIGYQSVDGAAVNPGVSVGGKGTPNPALQSLLYDVMFNEVSNDRGAWLAGMFLWALDTWNDTNSPGYATGGYRAVDFSFAGKPAADVVKSWYQGRTGFLARPQTAWHDFFAVDTLETPYTGDFNGDQKTDIITFTRQNPNAVGDVYVALSDGAKFGANTKWHDFFAITTDELVVVGDYNGDGKDDIGTWLAKTSRQVYVALSTGSGMLAASAWVNAIGKDATDLLFAGDANGDGKDDLIAFARKEGKVYVALSDGTKFATPTVWHGFFAVSTFERPRVADVNGDGKADIVTFATDSPTAFGDVYVATSDGSKFVGPTAAENDSSKWHDFFAIRPTEEIRVGDLNGDGKDDFFTFLPPPFAQAYSVLSQGTSMADNVLWSEKVAPLLGAGDNVYVGDVNGDGKDDIIIFAQKEGKVFVSIAP